MRFKVSEKISNSIRISRVNERAKAFTKEGFPATEREIDSFVLLDQYRDYLEGRVPILYYDTKLDVCGATNFEEAFGRSLNIRRIESTYR